MSRIIVITGNGKGKTTSAIGAAIRAAGRGLKVGFYQFLKSQDALYGEHLFFKDDSRIKIQPLGLGCNKDFKYTDKDIEAACTGFAKICNEASNYDILILDEISYPLNWGWFKVDAVLDLINQNEKIHFVLTGRDMPSQIVSLADTVSRVEEVKHIYTTGVQAQKGIEF